MKKNKEITGLFSEKNSLNQFMTILLTLLATGLNIGIAFILKMLMDVASSGTLKQLFHMLCYCGIYIGVLMLILVLKRKFYNDYIKVAISNYKESSFSQFLNQKMNVFDQQVTGKYISIFTNDITVVEEGYIKGKIEIITQIFTMVGGILAMFYLNWILATCVLVVSMLPIISSMLCSGKLAIVQKEMSNRNGLFVGLIKDILSGFSVVKSFQAEQQIEDIFKNENHKLEASKNNNRRTINLIELFSTLSSCIVEFVIFGVGAYLAIKNIISAGVVIAFIQLLNYVLGPVEALGRLLATKKAAKGLIEKMQEVTAVTVDEKTANEDASSFDDSIEFKHVSFGYEKDQDILKDINVRFEKGKSYMIVGASGSGKSTLLNMLLGYQSDYKGSITIDDKEIKDINVDCLYKLFSIVQQNVFLFNKTIKDNITMFHSFPEDEVANVVSRSGLEKLIDEKGSDFLCGENGGNLSGGERQRISIARCLIKKTPILLMDEATSALDAQTASMVEHEILKYTDMTRIVVSHKLIADNLQAYDSIIVLNNGMIEEQGSFEELMSRGGYFKALYEVSN